MKYFKPNMPLLPSFLFSKPTKDIRISQKRADSYLLSSIKSTAGINRCVDFIVKPNFA